MTRRFAIYCVTNKVNGKRYVGQTVSTVDVRWKSHVSSANRNDGCRILGAAIRKYGADSFTLETLESVNTQAEADASEMKWIKETQSRVPSGYNLALGGGGNGYHHEDSKRLIGESSKERLRNMSLEERATYLGKNIHLWTPKRRADSLALKQSDGFREKVSAGQKEFWSQFTAEEKTRRVLHQQAGMSDEKKSNRVRKAWDGMTPEAREARVRKTAAATAAAKSDPAHSKKMSEWQTERQKTLSPEQRSATVLKAWETRRSKYGQDGVKRVKTSAEYGESTARGWASMTPEARTERVRKVQDGRRRAKEARSSRLVRINLLPAEGATQ